MTDEIDDAGEEEAPAPRPKKKKPFVPMHPKEMQRLWADARTRFHVEGFASFVKLGDALVASALASLDDG